MASFYVRELVRLWLSAGAVQFYDTVNIEHDPHDDLWCTVEWGFSYPEKLTLCDEYKEVGTIQVVYFGVPGIGDGTLLPAAESEIASLMQQTDPTGRLVLMNYTAAEDFADENYYGVSFVIEYELMRQ